MLTSWISSLLGNRKSIDDIKFLDVWKWKLGDKCENKTILWILKWRSGLIATKWNFEGNGSRYLNQLCGQFPPPNKTNIIEHSYKQTSLHLCSQSHSLLLWFSSQNTASITFRENINCHCFLPRKFCALLMFLLSLILR